jgi:hypothetical protein
MHGHGDKPFLCTYEGCERANPGCGFPRQWNLRDHMRRVHNDNGIPAPPVAASSPPADASGASSSSKGRKRKSKDATETSTTGRKSSSKSSQGSVPVAAPVKVEVPQPTYNFDQWYEHQKALQTLVQGWTEPQDPVFLQQYEDAYGHMSSMQKLSYDYQSHRGSWQSS